MSSIELRGVAISRVTPDGIRALFSGFDLTVARGEHVLLIGANGVGKSSLLNVIAGIERPDSGLVSVDHACCGFVPQNFAATLLPWCSAERNALSLALYRGIRPEIARRRLVEVAKSFEIDFPLSQKAGSLSGGQKQLLCILRALVTNPSVLVFDEPCSALSELRTNQFWNTLAHYASDAAWLVTSHQVAADMKRVDRVVEVGQEYRCRSANL